MLRALIFTALLTLGLVASGVVLAAEGALKIPTLTSPVMDSAGVLDGNTQALMDANLRRLYAEKQTQVVVYTVPELDGLAIEDYSIKVVDQWKLGKGTDAKSGVRDRGALLLVSLKDRKMRIEVGRGLEGDLPDVYCQRIISDVMRPFFRTGQMPAGILAGVRAIVSKTDPDFQFSGAQPYLARTRGHSSGGSLPLWLKILIVVVIILFSLLRPRMGFFGGGYYGGGFGGGGFGGGSGGSGGFGGGGGGFSGGGSSGDW